MNSSTRTYNKIKIIFLSGAILLLLLSLLSYLQIEKLNRSAELVSHTNVVKLELERSVSNLRNVQNSLRGYLLTKDSVFLKSLYNASANYSIPFAKLSVLMIDKTARKNLSELKNLADTCKQNLQQMLEDSRSSDIEPNRFFIGKILMDKVKAKADEIIKKEDELLKSRTEAFYENTFVTPVVTFVIIIATLSLLIFSYFKIMEELGISQQLQTQLSEQNHELLRMNNELNSFVYISSHDLQEPLRKIQTFADRITQTETERLSEKGKSYLYKMNASASRMQNLIEDLLNYAQATSSNNDFENKDITLFVKDILQDMEEEIKQHNCKVIITDLGHAQVIPYQFRQLIINLLTNSLKFAQPSVQSIIYISSNIEEDLLVNITASESRKAKLFYHLTYKDNGIGFSPEYNEKIFEVFQRLHPREMYKGTGIGLAICKKIVDNHKGFITATGKLNEGAEFNIYLPITKS